ncbi:MAG: hypothetical protein N2690_10515, partial [Rhodocyclaceae bacterium]|nr:hypothetical protein [Rhodocyclaceae bacterium]
RGCLSDPPTVVDPPDARASETPPLPTAPAEPSRKGLLCRKLRALGIDAAPHMPAWGELLAAYSDDDILLAAERARRRRPHDRIHLNYLLPILRDRSPPRPAKFDPVEYVNRNRLSRRNHADNVIAFAEPVARAASAA